MRLSNTVKSIGLATLLVLSPLANAGVIFSDDFSDNSAGWTMDQTWEIAAAMQSTGGTFPSHQDPGEDNTATSDNGIAGVMIGGHAPTYMHNFYYLTSPVINAGSTTGTVNFEFYRWLNSDYTPYMQNRVDVYDGSAWQNLWLSGPYPVTHDDAWLQQIFDITAYANSALQVRMGYSINSGGVYTIGSWNVDDVQIYDESAVSVPEPGSLVLVTFGLMLLGGYRRFVFA